MCVDSRLVVELDGSQHIDSLEDDVRNLYMNRLGWSVARFPSGGGSKSRIAILDTIAAVCDGHIRDFVRDPEFQFYPAALRSTPHPSPLPLKGERGHEADGYYMSEAFDLGLAQLGRTWPNPAVGCVIVKDCDIVGRGATGDGGRPHAEEVALSQAGAKARGATAYVTLEPCGERSTGAASCSQRLVEAGVARVVYACPDPSPFASHKGPVRLEEAGIAIETGLLAETARVLIDGFVHFLDTGRPLVVESPGGHFDAEYVSEADDLDADLKAWGARGYRTLYVRPGSELAQRLRGQGLLGAN